MSRRVSCPYCNTSFDLSGVPPTGRAVCPRCGDTFAVKAPNEETGEPGDAGQETADTRQQTASPVAASPAPRRPRLGRLLVVAVGLALLGFGIGLGVTYFRGGFRSRPNPEPDSPPSAAATPPTELTGLAFLPSDTKLLIAVQPGPILAHAARTNQDPRGLLAKAGVPDAVFATLARAGLTLQQIDHVAAGTNADARELRFALVLSLRRPPDDEEQFLRALQAKPDLKGKKDRYEVTLGGQTFPLQVARVSPRVWVFGLGDRDFAAVERGGYGPGAKHLSADLQEMLGQKLPPDAAVWAAADPDKWAENPLVRLVVLAEPNLKGLLPVLAKGQAAVAGLSFDDPPRLRAFVRCADGATGETLRAYFQQKATADGARTGGAGEWAMFDTPFDPREGVRPLREMLENAR
jgi:hypothetical protein